MFHPEYRVDRIHNPPRLLKLFEDLNSRHSCTFGKVLIQSAATQLKTAIFNLQLLL